MPGSTWVIYIKPPSPIVTMLEPLLILLLWAALMRVIRVDLGSTHPNPPNLDHTMTTDNMNFTFTRSQLGRYLASLGDHPDQETLVYKQFGRNVWYVETHTPEENRHKDLEHEYGGDWFEYDRPFQVTDEDFLECPD
jgi:hypothetical protein